MTEVKFVCVDVVELRLASNAVKGTAEGSGLVSVGLGSGGEVMRGGNVVLEAAPAALGAFWGFFPWFLLLWPI
jgi:hypothetical protein